MLYNIQLNYSIIDQAKSLPDKVLVPTCLICLTVRLCLPCRSERNQ